MLAPWAELGAPAVPPAPFGGKSWRSAPAGCSDSTCEEVLEPAVRQEELPAVEPEVLAELVEQHELEVPVTSGHGLPAATVETGTAAVAAGTAGAAGTAAAAGSAGGGYMRGRVLLQEATGVIFLFLSSISWCLRSVLSALSTRWLKSLKRRLSSAY